jgi:DNA polymerase III subunit alpha
LKHAYRLQGHPKHHSVHAAGIILSRYRLDGLVPLMGEGEGRVIQFPQKWVEKLFLKFDILVLKNLDVFSRVQKKVGITQYPKNDPKTFEMIQKGETVGVFQIGTDIGVGMSKRFKPKNMLEIEQLLAIVRPSSKEQVNVFLDNRRKNIKEVRGVEGHLLKDAEVVEEILYDTFGVVLFQEQAMRILQRWAGYTLGEADLFRQAISKKNREYIEKEFDRFMARSKKMGRNQETSEKIYQLIVRFGDYGFNRSHAAAYSNVTYKSAYLKAHYPNEFFAELITSFMDKTTEASKYIKEALKNNVKVLRPNINRPSVEFVSTEDGILFGLAEIKHVGLAAARSIVEEHQKSEFQSFSDYVGRMKGKTGGGPQVIKSLVQSGAFDQFGERELLVEGEAKSLEGQRTFYSIIDNFDFRKKGEEESMGFTYLKKTYPDYPTLKKAIIEQKMAQTKHVWTAGTVAEIRKMKDTKGRDMAVVIVANTVENEGKEETREVGFYIFFEVWAKLKDLISLDKPYYFQIKKTKR